MLILAPLHKSWSLDVLRGAVAHTDKLPALWLWIFRLHMGIVYFYGGIAKFDHDWLNGLATRKLMGEGNRGTILEPLMQYEWVPYIYAWSGMLFDLLIPFLMLWKRTRNVAFVAAIIFHVNNHFVFSIGVFPMLALNQYSPLHQLLESFLSLLVTCKLISVQNVFPSVLILQLA